MLGWQVVGLPVRVVLDVARSALVGEPLTHVALVCAGALGQRCRSHAAALSERSVEAEAIPQVDQGGGYGGAEIAEELVGEVGYEDWIECGHVQVSIGEDT